MEHESGTLWKDLVYRMLMDVGAAYRDIRMSCVFDATEHQTIRSGLILVLSDSSESC